MDRVLEALRKRESELVRELQALAVWTKGDPLGVDDFYLARIQKVKDELAKVRAKIVEITARRAA